MANVTLTARELKNKNTGIDIYVPKYETIPGHLGSTVLYHVIVVTRLFYFKSQSKYKESDVVQFMVPHKYTAFEDLYHKLLQKFSSVVFPALPKKALIVNDAVVNERRRVIEAVMQQIAKTPKLACSSLTLEFLGVQQTGAIQMDERDSTQEPEATKESEEVVEDIDLFASDDKQPDHDSGQEEDKDEEDSRRKDDLLLLANSSSAKPRQGSSSIFDVEKDDNDDDIGDLFIPAGAMQKKNVVMEVENNADLLNIDDDLDKLLVSNKPSKPSKPSKPALPKKPVPKPRIKAKPELKPKPAAKPQFEETTGNDDLFKPSDSAAGKREEEDLFAPRKGSLRKPSHEEESLDDIFKSSAAKSVFPAADDDDDELFKPTSSSTKKLTEMDVNDISSYIQLNTEQQSDNLDLF